MADKRKASMSGPSPKRARVSIEDESDEQSGSIAHERPRNHPIYGQKSAFPGLDDGGDELFYGPPDDGMEYLRMVRSEASSLPPLFVAPAAKLAAAVTGPASHSARQDFAPKAQPLPGRFFEDEAYVAPVDPAKSTNVTPDEQCSEAQISYYNLLRHRFRLLRSTLRCAPPATAIAALDDSHPISLPRNHDSARKEWRRLVLAVNPQMAQLACMDQNSVLGVLGIVARELSDIVRSEHAERIRRMGAWAWGLLGKCRDVGELATEEVGMIRDLGKRAVKISHKFREAENSRLEEEPDASDSDHEEVDEPQDTITEAQIDQKAQEQALSGEDSPMPDATDLSGELEAAKARLQAQLEDDVDPQSATDGEEADAVQQTRAMLDMILTVVGEFFGQRDLLETREIWSI